MAALRKALTMITSPANGRLIDRKPPLVERTLLSAAFTTSATRSGPKPKPPPVAPAVAKATTKYEKRNHNVETDPEILAKYCCVNYLADKTEGGPGPELREDDYYPDWLWELEKTIVPHYEMDERTPEYWSARQRAHIKHQEELRKKMPFGVV